MSEHISLNDVVYFTANFYHPVSGFSYVADATPAWYVYESGATPILNGTMTVRDGIVGSYWGSFVASEANGFVSNIFYDVQVSGTVESISGFKKVKEFVVGDIFDANVVQVSGDYVHLDDFSGVAGVTAEQVWQHADRSLTEAVSVSGVVDANVVQVNGENVDYESGIVDANIVQVSGDYVHLDDFKANVSSLSTLTAEQVRQEMDANSLQLTSASGNVAGLAGEAMRGTNDAATYEQITSVSGSILRADVVQVSGGYVHLDDFGGGAAGATAEQVWQHVDRSLTEAVSVSGIAQADVVQVSGNYVHLDDFGGGAAGATAEQVWQHADRSLTEAVSVSGVVDANVVQMSGEYISPESVVDANLTQINGESFELADGVSVSGVVDANVVQVSGDYVHLDDFKADLTTLDTDIYFAAIKYISDLTNNADEFAVQWFKNDQPVSSGALTDPAISVYNTVNGTALINNQSMAYASPNLGVVRYNETPMVMVSGEPYLIETSGTIDSVSRVWKTIVGIDLL